MNAEVPTGEPVPFDEAKISPRTRRLFCSQCPREAKVSVRVEDGELVDCCWLHYQEIADSLRDETQ